MEVSATLKITKADGLGTQGNREIVTDTFVDFLKQQGMKEFHVWTVDIPADARYFQTLGAIGITTNCPAFIRSAIIEAK